MIDNTALIPPLGRLRAVNTAIVTALTPIVDIVRTALRLPDEETEDKVVYVEFGPPIVIENESIESSQRSWMPYHVFVYGLINDPDTLVLADFIEEVSTTLFTPDNIIAYRNCFSIDNGFSIERLTVAEVGFGVDFGQFKITLECLFNNPDLP